MPAWIALIVGVHFVALAVLLDYPLLYVTAPAVVAVAGLSIRVAHARERA